MTTKVSYTNYFINSEPEEDSDKPSLEDNDFTISSTTREFRAICKEAPHTLPALKLDLTQEEEARLSESALKALMRLKALWAEDEDYA